MLFPLQPKSKAWDEQGSYRQHRALEKSYTQSVANGYLPLLLVGQNVHLLRTSKRTIRLCRRFPELTDFLII